MDQTIGDRVMAAQARYMFGPFRSVLAAWLFGRHEVITHLGYRFRLSTWRGREFLLAAREIGGT
jgi:hypothetical protein